MYSRNSTSPKTTGGPHPGFVAIPATGLLIGSLILTAVLSGGHTIPSPFGTTDQVAGFFSAHGAAARFGAWLQRGSAIPLGIYTAIVYTRQRRLGIRVPGPAIGLFGGMAAAILLMVSAAVTWAEGQPAVSADPGLVHALSYFSFATGGFAHTMGLGLLVAGVAVPSLFVHTLPRWFTWAGLAAAAIAELCFLTMVIPAAAPLIPIGRFGCLIWIIAAGFLLPAGRRQGAGRQAA